MSRCRKLRESLDWSQKAMSEFLGVEQPTVWRLENNRDETGPESRLLELLSTALETSVISCGVTPSQALERLCLKESSAVSRAESTGTSS